MATQCRLGGEGIAAWALGSGAAAMLLGCDACQNRKIGLLWQVPDKSCMLTG